MDGRRYICRLASCDSLISAASCSHGSETGRNSINRPTPVGNETQKPRSLAGIALPLMLSDPATVLQKTVSLGQMALRCPYLQRIMDSLSHALEYLTQPANDSWPNGGPFPSDHLVVWEKARSKCRAPLSTSHVSSMKRTLSATFWCGGVLLHLRLSLRF
ncbi:hypothetical protein MPTK1_4g12960 [Marchantia polymorpha subsp. ruderalis]|uniref:Uncharacterized protein n=2 Tax=Marchantia polymorpha TaxID=3197 RepID=A0AAF6B9C6_MARPO|nr:hypothetical protein MARPO_0138s0033 [Marchantia polymorpha]BBN08610.1 hypothetical protein Mp_4g12960 [Marchantia polymorpha subsp. ruderalis]|eukprot:PTQ29597.1 hypothetical protein MARPO_0138s0033 [Marchantia polymorpha]